MDNTLTFGAAKDVVTPPMRTTMLGFGTVFGNPYKQIHDDLYVRTLVLIQNGVPEEQKAGKTLVFMSFDLLFHDGSLSDAVADYAQARYGPPRGALHVHYTHTHYGAVGKGYDFNFYDPEYEAFLLQRAKDCLDRAYCNLCEGSVSTARVEGSWNISRRLPVEGDTLFVPNPDGDRDPYLYLLRLCDAEGHVRALLTSFSCHPSNLNAYRTVSAEYPGRLCALLEAQLYGCTALFFQGAGGDAKLRIGAKTSRFTGVSFEEIDEAASAMALRVRETLLRGAWRTLTPDLAGTRFTVPLPLAVEPLSYFQDAVKEYAAGREGRFDKSMVDPKSYSGSLMMWACAQYIVDHYDELPDYLPLAGGVARIARDLHVFTMGGEPSVDVRRVLERLLPPEELLFFGYADAIAYIPTDKMLKEGGYEAGGRAIVEYRLKGACAPGIDALFLEYYGRALRALDA